MTARGRTIGIAGFIAVLAAWPIVLYVAGEHSPNAVPALTVAAFVFVIGGAIVLRSWAIAGTLMGLGIGVLLHDASLVVVLMVVGVSIGAALDPRDQG